MCVSACISVHAWCVLVHSVFVLQKDLHSVRVVRYYCYYHGEVQLCVVGGVFSVEQHPNMKSIIAAEVERLVYRPNVAQRAQ